MIPTSDGDEAAEGGDWRPFDQLYEVSSSGGVRNKWTKRPVQHVQPQRDDPHVYVRLVLQDYGQRRLALRHVVAHCWLPEAGYRLDSEGWPVNSKVVTVRNGDPTDCSAGNLAVGPNLGTSRRRPRAVQSGGGRQQRVGSTVTAPELMQQAVAGDGCNTAMSWPSGFDSAGQLLGSLSPTFCGLCASCKRLFGVGNVTILMFGLA